MITYPGTKIVYCPFLQEGTWEYLVNRWHRKAVLTPVIQKSFVKQKYKKIPPIFIDWWMDKKYLVPLRLIGIILEVAFKIVSMIIKMAKKMCSTITWAIIDWCME